MAASRLERDDDGLKLDPNFELLAILLALAIQEEDAERFLEVYDHVVPKSLSAFEVEGIKDRARELSDLPGRTLLELKAAQEIEAALSSLPSGGSLGHFISRRIADSRHHRDTKTGQTDNHQGQFLSKSGALLNRRLNAHSQTDALDGEGDAFWREETLSHLDDIGEYSRVDTGSQAGASYIRQQELFDQQAFPKACLADDDLLASGDISNIVQNQWSTMESATAHNKVQKAQTSTSVKQHKKLSRPKNSTSFGHEEHVLMNGTVGNVKSRTSISTDKDKHSIKSKPPQTGGTPSLGKSKAIAPKPNCLLSHVENSYFDDVCKLDDCTKEEKEDLIPKSPPVPDSPPFKSFEEVGHSVGELLTNSQPKNSTCPLPLFLSKTTATLAYPYLVDGSMAAKAKTKYGTIPYSDMNSAAGKDDVHKCKETTPPKFDAPLNHQLPNNITEDSTNVQSNSFSTSEVPSHVNKSAANVCSSGGEASDHLDKEEFDGAADEQPQNIAVKWKAAKNKKKKKKKKTAGTGVETVNANNMKLPVGAPPLPQSPPELRHKHRPKDSQNAGRHIGATSKHTNESSREISRHPPPMLSSDSVTSSGESSTDGGICMNDIGSQQHGAPVKKDTSMNYVDNSDNSTNQTSNINTTTAGAMDEGKAVLNSIKDIHNHENPSTELQPVNTTSVAGLHIAADIQLRNQSLPKTPIQQVNQGVTVKSDPRNNAKILVHVGKEKMSERSTTAGKPHSLSEPTANANSSADNDGNFIKVEYKRSLRIAKKRSGGVADDHKFAPTPGRYMDRDRDYFRNRNVFYAGLRKSSSEPAGISELGDKENEDIYNKAKPKHLSNNYTKMDTHLMSLVQTEPTTVTRFEFSYASKVKSNMKTSSLPPKLSPQALLDYMDDDHSENPANGENSSESVTRNKLTALESKALPSRKSVLEKNNPSVAEKSEFIAAHTVKEQLMKNNIRPEKHYVSQTMKPPNYMYSNKLGQCRSFQRSSSVDTSEATKKVSFDDNSIRRTIPPQGPEASVPYLDLTYAGCLKGLRPAISKSTAVNQKLLSMDAQQAPVAGLKDLKSQPFGLKPNEKKVLVTSKASIVLATNPSSAPYDTSRGNTLAAKPIGSIPISSTLSRNTTTSPTPSVGSSTSRPHPTFDLEPQDNFDITFGSVIVGKVSIKILGEDSSSAQRRSPVEELLSKAQMSGLLPPPPGLSRAGLEQMSGRLPIPAGLSCAELEQSFMSRDTGPSTKAEVDDVTEGESSAASGASFGKFNSDWGPGASLETKDDNIGHFNHLEVAGMLLAEWRKTQEEIVQNKVLVIG